MAPYTQAAKGASAALKRRKAPGAGSAPGSPGSAAQAAVDRAKGALAKHRGAKHPMQSATGGGLQGGPPAPAAPPSPSPQGGMALPRALRQQVEAGAMDPQEAFQRAFQNRAGFRERAMQAIGQGGPPPTMTAPAGMDAAPGRMEDLVRSFPPGGPGGMEFQAGGGLEAPPAGLPGAFGGVQQPGKGPAPMPDFQSLRGQFGPAMQAAAGGPGGAPFTSDAMQNFRQNTAGMLPQQIQAQLAGTPAGLPPGLADILAGGARQMPGLPPGMAPKGPYYGPMPQYQPGGGGVGGMGMLSGNPGIPQGGGWMGRLRG